MYIIILLGVSCSLINFHMHRWFYHSCCFQCEKALGDFKLGAELIINARHHHHYTYLIPNFRIIWACKEWDHFTLASYKPDALFGFGLLFWTKCFRPVKPVLNVGHSSLICFSLMK